MTVSRAARERELQTMVGELGIAKVYQTERSRQWRYIITCRTCQASANYPARWTSRFRHGSDEPATYDQAREAWAKHLEARHGGDLLRLSVLEPGPDRSGL